MNDRLLTRTYTVSADVYPVAGQRFTTTETIAALSEPAAARAVVDKYRRARWVDVHAVVSMAPVQVSAPSTSGLLARLGQV